MSRSQLTLHEVAEALGVHYMTVYRYVRLGQLDATKVGSTWHVDPEELDRFCNRTVQPADAAPLVRQPVDWSSRLETRLVAGDAPGCWSIIEAAMVAGYSAEDVYLDMITPALHRVGDRWAAGEIDVVDERRASVVVRQALGRLSPRFRRRGRARGAIIVGCVPGERHDVAVTILVDLFRQAGFEGEDLGADVPASGFALLAGRIDRLVAVCVSATIPGRDEEVVSVVTAVRAAMPLVPVVLGGQAVVDEEHALALGAQAWAADGRGAVAVIEALQRR